MTTIEEYVATGRKPLSTDDYFYMLVDEARKLPETKTQTELSVVSGWEKIYRSLKEEVHKKIQTTETYPIGLGVKICGF